MATWAERGEKAIARMRRNAEADIDTLEGSGGPQDRSNWTIWARHASPAQCQGCGEPVNYFDAADDREAAFEPNRRPKRFECPHCKTELLYVVPFISTGAGWKWGLAVWPATGKRKRNG